MTDVDPDAALAREFPEYTNIMPTHRLGDEFGDEKLFLGVNYTVTKSMQSLYGGECWKALSGCKWCVQAALIQWTQM
ncbi:hypothetical protein J1N35_021942 [Gossypium stocksii]|uniref:Uncharacterized protein n=1 Tax=Gossypium stocksii TaxID=47602 RepID=A0A9D3VFH2_9ROSI|nr:hypothetical protein J1N35_021942 [Gossypium stocksii]